MTTIQSIKAELQQQADPEKAAYLPQFFNAVPGGYGEGDRFWGVAVPLQRKTARTYHKTITLPELETLLQDPVHECLQTALFIMVLQYERTREEGEQEAIIRCYLNNLDQVNNWDLVDSSAYKLLGRHLETRDRSLLMELAAQDHLWKQRVAVIATLHFIRQQDFDTTLTLAQRLLHHPHDLIHKAVGWMLREVGNRNQAVEMAFLDRHYMQMPRTMLRYAIEKFDPELRQEYLKGMR